MSSLVQASGVPTGPQLDNRRIAAALIDLVVPLAMGAAAYAAGLSMTRGVVLVAIGWTLYYFFAFESDHGQTLGKRVMKLRVVSADGSPATMEQIAKRTVVRILDGHIVGLVVMLATGERRQRLGDIVAGTVVTEADSSMAPVPAAEPEVPVEPSNEPDRRKLRKPSFGLPSLRLPSLRKGADAGERPEPPRVGSPSATPSPVRAAQPDVEPDYREPAADVHEPEPYDDGQPFVDLARPEPPVEIEGPEPAVSLDDQSEGWDYEDSEPLVELEPEPLVELESEPLVELDEPLGGYEDREPVVELDEPLADYGDREPVVELDEPEPAVDYLADEPVVELEDPHPAVEVAGPQPVGELEREASKELDESLPQPEPDPERPSEPAADEELTVKPIETVSAIDLVMQDAEERRPADRR